MKIFVIVGLLVAGALAQESVNVPGRKPSKIRNPSEVAINRQKLNVDGDFNALPFAKNRGLRRDGGANVAVDRARKTGTLRTSGGKQAAVRQTLDANGRPTDNVNYAFKGNRGLKTGTGSVGDGGGRVNTARHNPGADWVKNGPGNADINLEGGPRRSGSATMRGRDFTANSDQTGKTRKLHSDSQTRTSGSGTIELNNGRKLDYTNGATRGRPATAGLADSNQGLGRGGFKWNCTGAAGQQSTCNSGNGQKIGSVTTDDQDGARLTNRQGTQLARVKTVKTGTDTYSTNLVRPSSRGSSRSNDPIYLGKAESFKQYDCYREVAGKADPDKNDVRVIKKTMKFVYNAQRQSDGTETYKFPDCFYIEAEVQLGANVDVRRLAAEFAVRVNPVGAVNCADPGTCDRGSCYYCDLCNAENAKLELLDNVDNADTCAVEGPTRRRVRVKVCPPPNVEDMPMCPTFSRDVASGYLDDNKAITAKILFWQRPDDEQKLSDQVLAKTQNPTLTQVLQAQYVLEKLKDKKSSGINPSTEQLRQHAIRKKETLLACEHGELDYDLAGSKISGKFLVTMSDAMKKKGFGVDSIFGADLCPEVKAIQNEEHQRLQQDWAARGKPESSGLLNLISGGNNGGSLFGGGSSSSGTSGSSSGTSGGGLSSLLNRGGSGSNLFNRFTGK